MSQKIALIIGNSDYQDANLAKLVTPHEDVDDLAAILRASDIGGFDHVTTLINESDAAIRLSIEDFFADKKPDDLLVMYFSGHGVRDEQGRLFLAVKNTRANRLRATAIPSEFITGEMDRSRSRRQVLILDCCHSGAFAQGTKAVTGESAGTGPAFEGNGYGRIVLTATDATQYAWEGDQIIGQAENSIFTHHLIEGLKTGKADADGDGRITVSEMYDYVYEQVVTTHPRQTPGKWSYKQQGDIVIAKNPHPPVVKAAPLSAELQQAIESPLANVREGAVRELAPMLRSSNISVALAAREALQHLSADDSRKVSIAAVETLKAAPSAAPIETPPPPVEPPPQKAQPAPIEPQPHPAGLVGKTIGRYQIVEQLWVGVRAEIYKAYQPSLERYVTIKLFHALTPDDPGFLQRFMREMSAVKALHHPGLAPVYDFGTESGLFYIVTEYLDGLTLKRRLQEKRERAEKLDLAEALAVIIAVGEALAYAHRRGVVHRDVIPGNVMLTTDGRIVLTDLGLLQTLQASNMTAGETVIGTPAYLSPEQDRGEAGDARSDIYSLGVMLYELTTGRLPYEGDTALAIILKHMNEPVPPPRSIKPDLPEALERVILKAMAKNPTDRFAAADDMVNALRAAAGQTAAQERILDAAIARSLPIDRTAGLLVQIRRTSSRGLRAVIKVDDSYPTAPEDVKSKSIEIEFPRGADGRAQPAELILEINAPDFEPQKQRKHIAVPPEKDSEVYTFLLTPRRLGSLVLTLDVYRGEINIASRLMRTTGVASDQTATVPKYLVSLPLILTSASVSIGFDSTSSSAAVAARPYAPSTGTMSRPVPAPSRTPGAAPAAAGLPQAAAAVKQTLHDRQRAALLAGVIVSIGWFAGWLAGIVIGSLSSEVWSGASGLLVGWIGSGVIAGLVLKRVMHAAWWPILSLSASWLLCAGLLFLTNDPVVFNVQSIAATWLIYSLTAMLIVHDRAWWIAVLTTAAASIAWIVFRSPWQLALLKFFGRSYRWSIDVFLSAENYGVLDLLIGPAITAAVAGGVLTILLYRHAEATESS
jgi:serine/threonine protein kinase/uncharacterized caspase-like protein